MAYTVPPQDVLEDLVRKHDKRIGLRMLYKRYDVPQGERHKYRAVYNKFIEMMPDAYGKLPPDDTEKGET